MPTRHVSFRIDSGTFERLQSRSRQVGQSRSHLAQTLIEEGLRMEAHPGIVFRSGPAGRRPGIAGGPDIWEVVRVIKGLEERGNAAVIRTTELTGLAPEQVNIGLDYYAEYRHEIDEWIERLDEQADDAEALWRRRQDVLRG